MKLCSVVGCTTLISERNQYGVCIGAHPVQGTGRQVEYNRARLAALPTETLDRYRLNQNEKTARRRHITNEVKLTAGCMDCGYSEHPAALDFDHRPGETKRFNLAQGNTRGLKTLFEEIMKCDVVCANCHRIRTSTR